MASSGLHDGPVHKISRSLVDFDGTNSVVVWWPSRKKGKQWEGELIQQRDDARGKMQRTRVFKPLPLFWIVTYT